MNSAKRSWYNRMSPRWHAVYSGAVLAISAAVVGYLLYLFSVPTWALCLVMTFLVLFCVPRLVWTHRQWVLANDHGAGHAVDQVGRSALWQLAAGGALVLASGYLYYFTGMQETLLIGAAAIAWQAYVARRISTRQPSAVGEASTVRSPSLPTAEKMGEIYQISFYPTVCLFLGVAYCFLESYYLGVGVLSVGLALLPRAVRKIRQILASARSEHER